MAILGTLAANIWVFAMSSDGTGPLKTVLDPLTNGKFFAMLAMMFGVGLAVQYRTAAAYGRRWPGRYRWRQVLLLAEGALHTLLLFAWDVLMGYAVTGLVVIWLLRRSERVRTAVMWSALAVNTLLFGGMTLVYVALTPQRSGSGGHEEWKALFLNGGYLEQVAMRWEDFLGTRSEAIASFPMLLFLFLLGVRLYRAGVFDDDQRGQRYRKLMTRCGLGLGLPLCVLGSHISYLGELHRYGFSIVLMLGYVGLAGWLLDRTRSRGQVPRSLSAVGRTALTCYVLQNLLGSVIFYGWGFGLASYLDTGDVGGLALEGWVLGAALVIALALVIGARSWLRRFDRGPLEAAGARLVSLVPEHFPRRVGRG
ncbi:DUF418 domain-containing protein [Nocardiopsis metallicus]|uniref:DUF418 domain-containing protein n=1 Tax=Nocardiopsis metallicus TaxID=179819 RepID=A0A840WPG5_9ACTN|nr:DUF418 domain-containing protein [Nocardiopsis metallicus]MBB5493497.1 uncharacterized protein [Nocardiopsis metallicus]